MRVDGGQGRTYSVRRSLATCGVMVMLPAETVVEMGGGRRKEMYQYMGDGFWMRSKISRAGKVTALSVTDVPFLTSARKFCF